MPDTSRFVPPPELDSPLVAQWINDSPHYWRSRVKEYRGNPLAECISPIPDNDEAIMRRLTLRPQFRESELALSRNSRILLPERLLDVFIPVSYHVKFYKWLYRRTVHAYRSPARNPLTPEGQYFLHQGKTVDPPGLLPGKICLLAALSGTGKTALVRRILLSFGKPVIRHHRYQGKPFTEVQILFLWRDAPSQASLKMWAQRYGIHADALLGQEFYTSFFSNPRQSRSALMSQLKKIVANHFVSLLIIDVAENLTLSGPDGLEGFQAEFESLRDEFGVSIVLIGTYKLVNRLADSRSSSFWRKALEGGYWEIKRPASSQDASFRQIAEAVWEYQWLREPLDFKDDIASTLYGCSAGITGIMILLVILGQIEALEQGKERLDSELLLKVYQERFTPLHDILQGLLLNRKNILNRFDDLYKKGITEVVNQNSTASLKFAIDAERRRTEEQVGSNPARSESTKKKPSGSVDADAVERVEKEIEHRKGVPAVLKGR